MSRRKANRDIRQKIGFAIPPELLRELDAQATKENRSRSNMLCQFIRDGLK
jgi:metal-responsive CopG/Arc/MetJ family transcriptional regulator